MSHHEEDYPPPIEGEQGQDRYCYAARFATEQAGLLAYTQAQAAIFAPACDISAYRFLLGTESYVAVLGKRPPADLDERLQALLATGEPTTLPQDVRQALFARRAAAARQGTWVERHYRPGNPPRVPRRQE